MDHYGQTYVVPWQGCGLVMVPAAKKHFLEPHESRVKGRKDYSYQKSPGRVSAHHPLHSAHRLVGESTWRMHRATRESWLANFVKLWVFRWVLILIFFVSSRQRMNWYMGIVRLGIIKMCSPYFYNVKNSKLANCQIFCILNKYCNNFGTLSSTPVCSYFWYH